MQGRTRLPLFVVLTLTLVALASPAFARKEMSARWPGVALRWAVSTGVTVGWRLFTQSRKFR